MKRASPGWRKPPHAKRQWGSQPGKERGGQSIQETLYIEGARLAVEAGARAARDPKAHEGSFPPQYVGELREYWLAGFRKERRR